jgi:hypothetical protein
MRTAMPALSFLSSLVNATLASGARFWIGCFLFALPKLHFRMKLVRSAKSALKCLIATASDFFIFVF